jgi:hypothetical protein
MVKTSLHLLSAAVFLLVLSVNHAWASESWNPDQFRVIDAPWVDNQQFSLYLSGGGNFNMHDDQHGNQPVLNTYDDRVHTTENQSNINVYPNFNYQYQTLAWELGVKLPFSVSFSLNESIDDRSPVYSFGTPSWQREIAENTQLGADPQIALTYYYESWFINPVFSANGDESFNHAKIQKRNFSNGSWQPEVVTFVVTENYSFQANQVFRMGWGRIYEGNHAFQALQLLEELSEEGQLQHSACAGDIRDLSGIIMHARRADIKDTRLKIKAALKNILLFLEKRGLVLPGNTDAFLTVDDVYRNITEDNRPFGFSVNSRLGAGLFVKNHEQNTLDQNGAWTDYRKDESVPQQAFAGAEFRYEVPLSRQWQVGTSANLDCTFISFGFSDMRYTPYQIIAEGNVYADYYFNTRWKIGASAKVDFQCDTEPKQDAIEVNDQSVLLHFQREYAKIDASIHAQNQLAPDFYLTASLGGFFENQRYKELFLTGEYHPAAYQPTLEEINTANQTAPKIFEMNWYFTVSINYRLM